MGRDPGYDLPVELGEAAVVLFGCVLLDVIDESGKPLVCLGPVVWIERYLLGVQHSSTGHDSGSLDKEARTQSARGTDDFHHGEPKVTALVRSY